MLPESATPKINEGKVRAVGPGRIGPDGKRIISTITSLSLLHSLASFLIPSAFSFPTQSSLRFRTFILYMALLSVLFSCSLSYYLSLNDTRCTYYRKRGRHSSASTKLFTTRS